jgi:hypothetical protein
MKFTCALVFLLPLALYANEGGAPAEGGGSEGGSEASKKPLPPPQPDGPDNISTYLHLQVNNLTKAQPPRIQDRKLILTWKGDTQPRYVAAAFLHESWRQKHIFWRNQNGVYFLVYDLASDTPTTLDYRLIIDGLWQSDSTNPNQARNDQGISLSRVSLPSTALPGHHGPVQGSFGEVEFVYHGKAGQQVSIIGNFNQWDPFAHFLDEGHPGEYHLKLTLPAGTLLYRFVIGTRSVLDDANPHTGHDAQGGTFSYFENKYVQPATVLDATMAVAAAHH